MTMAVIRTHQTTNIIGKIALATLLAMLLLEDVGVKVVVVVAPQAVGKQFSSPLQLLVSNFSVEDQDVMLMRNMMVDNAAIFATLHKSLNDSYSNH